MTSVFPGNTAAVSMDGLLRCGRWHRTMNISGSVYTAFHRLWIVLTTSAYIWKNLYMANWDSHETQQEEETRRVWVHVWGWRGPQPSALWWPGKSPPLVLWESTWKKAGCRTWLCIWRRKTEREAARAEHHFDILEGNNRNQCIFLSWTQVWMCFTISVGKKS